jgi:HPt (histidine-containing phosphotransfer) domain-containing protein
MSTSQLATQMQNASCTSVLNHQILERLSRLDPGGRSKLLERVLAAFETSSEQMRQTWATACQSGDVTVLHHIAHTLKSSSASIGALGLSQLCAKLEEALHAQNTDSKKHIEAFDCTPLGVLSQELNEEWQSVLMAIPLFLADRLRSQP